MKHKNTQKLTLAAMTAAAYAALSLCWGRCSA